MSEAQESSMTATQTVVLGMGFLAAFLVFIYFVSP